MLSIRQLGSAALLALAAASATASPLVSNVTLVSDAFGGQSAGFSTTHLSAGLFTDTFYFGDAAGLSFVNGGLSTIGLSAVLNIDFISATLNGVNFDFKRTALGGVADAKEVGKFANQELMSPFTLIVTGYAGKGLADGSDISASYSGNLNVKAANVPEPDTLALLAVGLAGAAFVARRRLPSKTKN